MAHITEDHVKQKTTTTGTGPFALGAVPTGQQAFSAKCAVGDTFTGAIVAVDGNGAPTGEWQSGVFTYSAANQVSTAQVYGSSNAGSAVSFGTGDKLIFIGLVAKQASWIRERLAADRTYYVRSDGSDSNSGLVDSAGGAFLTIQKAVDVVSGTLDIATSNVVIQVGSGTFAPFVLKTVIGSGSLTVRGNVATPANVVIAGSAGNCVTASPRKWKVEGLKLTNSAGNGVFSETGTTIQVGNMDFGSCPGNRHIFLNGGAVEVVANYTISGGAYAHFGGQGSGASISMLSKTVTLTGTPAFTTFADAATLMSMVLYLNTFTGAATGKRYNATLNAVINTFGSGATHLPGDVAGTATTGLYA